MKDSLTLVRLVERYATSTIYGFLAVYGATQEDIQKEIDKIENSNESIFVNRDFSINDVLNRFPKDWKHNFIAGDYEEPQYGNDQDYDVRI